MMTQMKKMIKDVLRFVLLTILLVVEIVFDVIIATVSIPLLLFFALLQVIFGSVPSWSFRTIGYIIGYIILFISFTFSLYYD
jgi:sterol desaturase/sphingolipid hydroxylase (fatty acid hydroxylase superfamily)